MDETYIINDVKEKLCYVSTDFERELQAAKSVKEGRGKGAGGRNASHCPDAHSLIMLSCSAFCFPGAPARSLRSFVASMSFRTVRPSSPATCAMSTRRFIRMIRCW